MPGLLAAMREAPDFYFDSVSQVRMGSWSAGRVALVGDAGYCPSPLSGQGSSLALVGAYVLASELRAARRRPRGRLRALPAAHAGFRRAQPADSQGQRQAVHAHQPPADPAADQGIRVLPYMPGKNWVLSLATRGVKEAANAITLPSPAPS